MHSGSFMLDCFLKEHTTAKPEDGNSHESSSEGKSENQNFVKFIFCIFKDLGIMFPKASTQHRVHGHLNP